MTRSHIAGGPCGSRIDRKGGRRRDRPRRRDDGCGGVGRGRRGAALRGQEREREQRRGHGDIFCVREKHVASIFLERRGGTVAKRRERRCQPMGGEGGDMALRWTNRRFRGDVYSFSARG
jgi:hypothetical protein